MASANIVVTGATGQLGSHIIDALVQRGAKDVVGTGRSHERLAALKSRGIKTAALDYSNPSPDVFKKDDIVILISGSEVGQRVPQHKAVIEAAKHAGVSRIIYTSFTRAATSPYDLATEHKETEAILTSSGVPYTILRNCWYNDNYKPAFDEARKTGKVLGSAKEGRVSGAARKDYAEAAAVVALGGAHTNKIYELAGDESYSLTDLAAAFSKVLKRPVEYVDVSSKDHEATLLSAGLDAALVDFVVKCDAAISQGHLQENDRTLSHLIGHPTTTIEQSAQSWL